MVDKHEQGLEVMEDEEDEEEISEHFINTFYEATEEVLPVASEDKTRLLETINRSALNFDVEKYCSVTMKEGDIYACLVCGKYFKGKKPSSNAHRHSLNEKHEVFLGLETKKFFRLPDNHQIIDQSLEDILHVLDPTFMPDQIEKLEMSTKSSTALDKSEYLPGNIGLNNIKANNYCNVVFQALSRITPLRNFFLSTSNYSHLSRTVGPQSYLLVQRLGELLRKLWNTRSFKTHISPHEILKAVQLCSNGEFQTNRQSDCLKFLCWFLKFLHNHLQDAEGSSIVSQNFEGTVKVTSRKRRKTKQDDENGLMPTEEYQMKVVNSPFLYLTCELPSPDAFQRSSKVNLVDVLPKFSVSDQGEYREDFERGKREITVLPPYLILSFKRFSKAPSNSKDYKLEKNPTFVSSPLKNLDLGKLMTPEAKNSHTSMVYNMIANIIHYEDPDSEKWNYKVQVLHKGSDKWFVMQDHQVYEIKPEMVTCTESYVQELKREEMATQPVEQVAGQLEEDGAN